MAESNFLNVPVPSVASKEALENFADTVRNEDAVVVVWATTGHEKSSNREKAAIYLVIIFLRLGLT